MKTRIDIRFEARDIPGEAAAILEPSGCGLDVAEVIAGTIQKVRTVWVTIKLYETDERVAKVLRLLEQHRVEFRSITYPEYSNEDLDNARLLRTRPAFDLQIYAGFHYGTEYDWTHACSHCKTGGKQTSALSIDKDSVKLIRKHRAAQAWTNEIIVDKKLRKKLVDAGITGISFGEVRVRNEDGTWRDLPREQILIEHTMPPMRKELTELEEQRVCKVCRRGGHASSPAKPYREEDLAGLCDFNLTWEWFGEFRTADHRHGISFSHPGVYITPKAMRIFRDAGVKTFDWTPVEIAT